MSKQPIHIEQRSFTWWVFTLLPLIISFLLLIIELMVSHPFNQVIFNLIEQLSLYAIILSSGDMALRYRQPLEETSELPQNLATPFLMILLPLFILIPITLMPSLVTTSDFGIPLLVVSAIFSSISILSYNNNPKSLEFDSEKIINQKTKDEEESTKRFNAPQKDSKIPAKWGEGS